MRDGLGGRTYGSPSLPNSGTDSAMLREFGFVVSLNIFDGSQKHDHVSFAPSPVIHNWKFAAVRLQNCWPSFTNHSIKIHIAK